MDKGESLKPSVKEVQFDELLFPFEGKKPDLAGKYRSDEYRITGVCKIRLYASPNLQSAGKLDLRHIRSPRLIVAEVILDENLQDAPRSRFYTKSNMEAILPDSSVLWGLPSADTKEDNPNKIIFHLWQNKRDLALNQSQSERLAPNPLIESDQELHKMAFVIKNPNQ